MKKLKVWQKVIVAFVIFFASITIINFCFNVSFAYGQYGHNTEQWNNKSYKLITNQDELTNYKYGFGNVVDNGCGSIVIYNILSLDGKDVSFPEVIKKVSLNGLPLFGYLGTFPHTVISILNSFGYKTSVFFDTQNFDEIAQNHKYNIYCYISTTYGHYELAYDFNGTDYQFVNPTLRTTFANEVKNSGNCFFKALITID